MSGLGVRGARAEAAAALLCAIPLALGACGDDDDSPGPPKPPTGSTSSATSSSSAGGGGAGGEGQGGGGGVGGDGGATGGGGAAGAGGGAGTCGDGVAEAGEDCDGADLGGQTCASFGFDTGTLACSAACLIDTAGCSGVEGCWDAADNDGDGGVDCADADCAGACADACAAPPALPDPTTNAPGTTLGHAPMTEAMSCTGAAGPGVAYQLTAAMTGFLDVLVHADSDADLAVSVRTSCAGAASELACDDAQSGAGAEDFVSIPITQNDTVYVVIAGADATQEGPFTLSVKSRQTVCGDGVVDPTEECDVLVNDPMDGCSDTCTLELTETEPNGTTTDANPYAPPYFAAITPAGDVDVVSVVVPGGAPTSALVAETIDISSAQCANNQLDSVVEILDAGGVVLASDDDGGAGNCSKATAHALAPGTYYVRVTAAPGATPIFAYRLDATVVPNVCGDGAKTPGEQCDDGNTSAGDGCSPTCQFEVTETEPNDTTAQADPYANPWRATIAPSGDLDVVSIAVPGPASTLGATIGDNGTNACAAYLLDSFVEILAPDGTTVLASDNDSAAGSCSFASATNLAAGLYYVRVKSAPFQPNATFFYTLSLNIQ